MAAPKCALFIASRLAAPSDADPKRTNIPFLEVWRYGNYSKERKGRIGSHGIPRYAVEESLRIISVDELKALTDELFPYADHPWLETFLNVVSDPTSGTFHHAATDDRIHILYCHDKEIGMWFIRGSGKGPLQPEELKIMKEIVEAGR